LVVNDICEKKIKMLKNNLSVYSKGLNLLTIHNKDYAEIKVFPVDVVLICPPWGGMDVG
jgi:predicted RNA methylase